MNSSVGLLKLVVVHGQKSAVVAILIMSGKSTNEMHVLMGQNP